jgi:type II secretory pathway component PulC
MTTPKSNGWRWATLALLALAALLALRMGRAWKEGEVERGPAARAPGRSAPFRWPTVEAGAWQAFRAAGGEAVEPLGGGLADRFGLAGVFLILSADSGSGVGSRGAILDDRREKKQIVAGEGSRIGEVRVVRVERDLVVLEEGGMEATLRLSEESAPRRGPSAQAARTDAGGGMATNRFTRQVDENRWVYDRDSLLDYYQQMMDDPERLAALFLAMRAVRDSEGRVAGYRLDMEGGENEFYAQVGFEDGDVVRSVNSFPMTRQSHAELFIGKFVQNELDTIVIEVERGGEPLKLIYLAE